ncbi:Omp28-related outer membrane protein [Taibaiella helva]|uniref:Omp28-related outer membrane protein n=1 Tax=Taibaiella helva TaxID=2301235 RepID=UPI000E5953B5|nr:Omp28-related outer membrane protein [Taibaiella helva]
MRKILIGAASAGLLFAASCKEHGVPINITEDLSKDSTSVGAVEEPQKKRVLIEELSGVRCVVCPKGAEKLKELETQHPGRVSIVSLHAGDLTTPLSESHQDFRTEDGENLLKQTLGEKSGSKPSSVFDRLPFGNQGYKYLVNGYMDWPDRLSKALDMNPTTPVNIALTSVYDDAKEEYVIEVTVKYTKAVNEQYALNLFLTEDKIIDAQEFSSTNIQEDYEFNHVFRKSITPVVTGKPILPDMDTKEAGRIYWCRTTFKIDKTDEKQRLWNPANMKVTAFASIMDPNNKRVIQVQETKLVP